MLLSCYNIARIHTSIDTAYANNWLSLLSSSFEIKHTCYFCRVITYCQRTCPFTSNLKTNSVLLGFEMAEYFRNVTTTWKAVANLPLPHLSRKCQSFENSSHESKLLHNSIAHVLFLEITEDEEGENRGI